MSILKYKDPSTGEYKITRTVKVVGEGGGAAEQLTASVYPDYVTPEVIDMAERVRAVRKDNSIVFLAMSDSHYCADQVLNYYERETNESAIYANQGAKVLSYLIQPDFVAHLGDVASGAASTTPEMLKAQTEGFISYFREARSDLPVFIAIGNHDTGIYYHETQDDGQVHTMSGKYLYDTFTAHSESADTVMGGKENGGYCYRDFADKKLRVFLLNTSEKLIAAQTDQATYGAQRVWLANALLDLNNKDDAADWSFMILSHYPADYGGNMPLSELLKAYVQGASFNITDPVSDYYVGDKTDVTVNFAGKNGAKMIAQFHGHLHNFKADKLYSYATGAGVQYDAHRVCIPNGQYNRENYYTTVGNYTDVDFSEETKWPKTADTADGTSFVVNVIDPDEEKIYSFCFGAGYDRVIGYGSTVYYSVTAKLTGVTADNDQKSVESGAAYTVKLTPDEGYHFKDVIVTMGGKYITDTAYANGVVTIASVTGNVVITAKAQPTPNFTNLVTEYEDGTYINSSGVVAARKGVTTSGFISVKAGAKTVRIAGEGLSIDPLYTRIASYDANHNFIAGSPYKNMGIQHSSGTYYQGKLIDEASTLITLELEKNSILAGGVYLRVCVNGEGKELIVTVDEEVSYG